jgi:hypothetical protein
MGRPFSVAPVEAGWDGTAEPAVLDALTLGRVPAAELGVTPGCRRIRARLR